MRKINSAVLFLGVLVGGCATSPSPSIGEDMSKEVADQYVQDLWQKTRDSEVGLSELSTTRDVAAEAESRRRFLYQSEPLTESASTGELLNLRLRQVPLPVFARLIARLSNRNIVVHYDAADKNITADLFDLPWREALRVGAQTHALSVNEQGGVVILIPTEHKGSDKQKTESSDLFTGLFQLLYAQPDAIKAVIEPLFADAEDKPSFSVDPRTRALLVQGNSEQMAIADDLIKQLDVPIKQVRIEAFIVEAGEDFERSLGARLGINRSATADGISVAGVAGDVPGDNGEVTLGNDAGLAVDLALSAPSAGLGFLLDSRRLKLELTALENEGKSQIISNPKVFTLDNQEAVIFQGDEVPYFTVSDNGTQTEFKEAGIRLTVTPSIVGRDSLMMDVAVSKDTVDTRLENPPITRRQVSTKLKIRNGALVVIGGIYFDTQVRTAERVPLLGQMPLLGALFRRTQKATDIKELLVFIAPRIVDG